ncbi:amidophosphoribosyltransferase [Oceanisphaera pacifica]|uniref:Amidophosphoribosyltransferase n=1 Tax=Oceanisphaera pacifica TaxID=2818389 RepID=A0ABS3NJ89_9GAMM|nr:amidophosphoribosyltransferase [Oceanisphaera pacifica]MBO1520628.1 amidophosphoribosyltransferase [Oceanisphaera pacifica]
MCGIVGILGTTPVNQALYDGLTVLQHRGQDAAGIVTIDGNTLRQRKANGLVRDVFEERHMERLIGNVGIGHVRYPTAGSSSVAQAQPFYVNSPFGIALAHNGNLTNARELKEEQFRVARRHINTSSDSEILLNVFAHELDQQTQTLRLEPSHVFAAISKVHEQVKGAYATVAAIIGHGMLAFRDPNGIRPLVLGKRDCETGGTEYMVASESVALNAVGFELIRDIAPGEAVYITEQGELFTEQCAAEPQHQPCIFEYVYFARPDSFIDKVSVYGARAQMGQKLGDKIAREWEDFDIDVVIPIPETSCDIALEIAHNLDLPYRQGFVKNRYIGRTFIMPGQVQREQSVRRKLNAIPSEFAGKNVLLVDDSIVRGTTSEQIIKMAREAGAKKVYFASAAPEIRFPNVYGIDMPSVNELIAYGREVDEICQLIGADGLIYQELSDLESAVRHFNPDLRRFETSVFTGEYVTQDVNQAYLDELNALRNDGAKLNDCSDNSHLGIYNEGQS